MERSYVYILTNTSRSVLYTGVTANLRVRLMEHLEGHSQFTSRYKAFELVYFEEYTHVMDAIAREKQIKSWSRRRKMILIDRFNPTWRTLNEDVM